MILCFASIYFHGDDDGDRPASCCLPDLPIYLISYVGSLFLVRSGDTDRSSSSSFFRLIKPNFF